MKQHGSIFKLTLLQKNNSMAQSETILLASYLIYRQNSFTLSPQICFLENCYFLYIVKPVYNGHPKCYYFQNVKTGGYLMQDKSNAESSYRSFLHYFQPALSNHLHLYKIHTCLKRGRYRQVLLYMEQALPSVLLHNPFPT